MRRFLAALYFGNASLHLGFGGFALMRQRLTSLILILAMLALAHSASASPTPTCPAAALLLPANASMTAETCNVLAIGQ